MLKKALEKLDERQAGKLRGYLEALTQMGVLSGTELKSLYLYYHSENRMTKWD